MYNLSYLQNEYGGLFNVLVALLVRYTSELKNKKKKLLMDDSKTQVTLASYQMNNLYS